jgi:putative thioredoxin
MAGIDLSSLIKPASAPEPTASVSSLVMVGSKDNLRQVLELSTKVPVLVEFHATDANSLGAKLDRIVQGLAGKLVLVRIDGQKNADIAAAFKVDAVPTVLAIIKGQPIPLLEADLPEAEVAAAVEKLMQVAGREGLTGFVVVGDAKPVDAVAEKAYQALEAGDLAGAKKVFTAALSENPHNIEYASGLAQVELMERIQAENPHQADVLVASGMFAQGFELLLTEFAATKSEAVKNHLLDLFKVAGQDDPDVIAARKRLTSLLY